MAYDGVIDDFRAIRALRTPSRVPCCALSEEFDVKWHGRYTYEEFCTDGGKMSEVLGAAVDEFGYDWAWVQIDDCFEFEPLGVRCRGEGNIVRATVGYLPATRDGLGALKRLDPARDGRMPEKLGAIRALRDRYGETVLVVGSCAAPFSAVGLTWGIEQSMFLLVDDAPLLHDAMAYWAEFYKRYIRAQRDAGAHAVWLGDCNAFGGLLSARHYAEHVLPQTRELVRYAEEELGVMVWLHNSEIALPNIRGHAPLGVSIENVGPAADIAEVREGTAGAQAISGNLDPIEVLWRGTPEQIACEVTRIMSACKPGGAFAMNTGEMVPRGTPAENMRAYTETVRAQAEYTEVVA